MQSEPLATLANKRILLGMTGGIAAYKCAELVRLLGKAGAQVRVVMTRAATEFITPLTMQALSGHKVHLDLLDADAEAGMGHIELARWPDLILVAPASADFLARACSGRADDLLTTLLLASKAPLAIAPAMNQGMWLHQATQDNLALLSNRGCHIFGPAEGSQACGDVGPGRMLEPAELAAHCAALFQPGLLSGLHIVLTAGPTREAIDPVRFITNHSSGKMAYALASEAINAGARVTLISGPVNLTAPDRARVIDVTTAQQMLEASLSSVHDADVFIGVAAVADYRVAESSDHKIKKHADTLQLTLIRNPDIIGTVAALEKRPFVVGFAAETRDIEDYGRDKLLRKNLDLLFANDATATFNSDSIAATALWPIGSGEAESRSLGPGNKHLVARQMLSLIRDRLYA
jgi:phosphopantothenoylcysteine decarboxylase/phosphopantothenate--cysteine ligase